MVEDASSAGGVVRVVAPREVDLATADAARRLVVAALAGAPRRMVFDFRHSTFCGSDAAYLVADAAGRCRRAGVAFGALEGPALTRLANLLGITNGDARWIEWAHQVAAGRPLRLSESALLGVVSDLSDAQLDAARQACWRAYHESSTTAAKHASQRRLQVVLAQAHARGLPPIAAPSRAQPRCRSGVTGLKSAETTPAEPVW